MMNIEITGILILSHLAVAIITAVKMTQYTYFLKDENRRLNAKVSSLESRLAKERKLWIRKM